jgi:hypothetical protein
MTYDDVINFFGSQNAVAAALGLTQPTVSSWHGTVPDQHQYALEILTAGALRVEDRLRKPKAGRAIFEY